MKITDYCEAINKTIEVSRHPCQNGAWFSTVKGMEIKEGGILKTPVGTALTPESAIADLADQIRGKRVVFNAFGPDRIEYFVPKTLEGR